MEIQNEKMDVEDIDSHGGDKGHGSESWSATMGSGGSSLDGSSKKWKKKFVAPMCSCEDYAILFQSTTLTNPNRLFFECQHFKRRGANYKYFAWLDEYAACFHDNGGKSTEINESLKGIEERMAALEKLMIGEGKKLAQDGSGNKFRGIVLFMLGFAFAFCWIGLLKSSQ